MNKNKEKLIAIFKENVQGKKSDVSTYNIKHDGKRGHWLERQFSIPANADNKADILGYELKNETTSRKTTFGDWSANRYIYKTGLYEHLFEGQNYAQKQDSFCKIFGKANLKKEGRYSWSGSPAPKIDYFNKYGQKLVVDDNLDIIALYSFKEDERNNKFEIVPIELQKNNLELARWFGQYSPSDKRTDKSLKRKLEDKFNDNG